MREIEVMGKVMDSDKISIKRIDLPNNKDDNIKKLQNMGVDEETLDEITINKGREDILGTFTKNDKKIGLECKGTTKDNYNNFVYWGKGMLSQMAQLGDKTDANSVGIAIPREVKDVLRGIMSSYQTRVSDDEVNNQSASELYGDRQSAVLKMYDQDDYIVLADSNGIKVQEFKDFFGL